MENTSDSRAKLLAEVRRRSEHFESVRVLADKALEGAAEDRATAIRAAMPIVPVKDVAEAAGLSRQRLYRITGDNP